MNMSSKLYISNQQKSGGVVSSVTEATLEHQGSSYPVVIKHTHKKITGQHFSHTDTELQKAAPRTHALDRQVLIRLQNHPKVKVPYVYQRFSKGQKTVMSDFTAGGYQLLQDKLVQGTLGELSAVNVGRGLAELQLALNNKKLMKGIKPVEDSRAQIRERLSEAHMLLYGNLDLYRALETKLLEGNDLMYTDGHPKNMAVNDHGEVMIFDFGRIVKGSAQYPPANFLAHIGLAWIGGTMQPSNAKEFIDRCYNAYNAIIQIEQEWFVRFFAAELVHRGLAMRWVDPKLFLEKRKLSARLTVHAVFLDVFENNYVTLKQLLDSIETQTGRFD